MKRKARALHTQLQRWHSLLYICSCTHRTVETLAWKANFVGQIFYKNPLKRSSQVGRKGKSCVAEHRQVRCFFSLLLSLVQIYMQIIWEIFPHCVVMTVYFISVSFHCIFVMFCHCKTVASVPKICLLFLKTKKTTHGKESSHVYRQPQKKKVYRICLKFKLTLNTSLYKYFVESQTEWMNERDKEKLKAQQPGRLKEIKTWHFPQWQTSADY